MMSVAVVNKGEWRLRVFMMDLWATVPYYTAYLAKALMEDGRVDLTLGSISYYLDPACFRSRGIRNDPGLMDVVGRFQLPRPLRRALKLAEGVVNLCALTLRFMVKRPDVVHVQFLPMLTSRVPMDLWFVEFCRKRGAKIVTTHHLPIGMEVSIENRIRSVKAKARVVWLGEKGETGSLHAVGLELLEAQNVWGMTFPPDDWSPSA